MRKIFGGLRSETGVRIHETLSTMVATWERQGLDPPDQLTSVLGGGGERPDSRAEASTTELR
jgi:transposase